MTTFRNAAPVLVVIFGLACATGAKIRTENRTKLLQLSVGMGKSDVLSVMGTEPRSYCGQTWFGCVNTLGLGRETISNPYRNETVRSASGEAVEVLYYYTDIKKSDGAITDDELTPIVLENGVVVGWGWSFVDQSIERYEIRIR